MPRKIISTPEQPSSPFFAQAVEAGPFIFVSGTIGIDPATGDLAGQTIQEQTRQALHNCAVILAAAGASLDDVVEVGVLLANPADRDGMNDEVLRAFPTEVPARYIMKLGVEIPGVIISIRMTAYRG